MILTIWRNLLDNFMILVFAMTLMTLEFSVVAESIALNWSVVDLSEEKGVVIKINGVPLQTQSSRLSTQDSNTTLMFEIEARNIGGYGDLYVNKAAFQVLTNKYKRTIFIPEGQHFIKIRYRKSLATVQVNRETQRPEDFERRENGPGRFTKWIEKSPYDLELHRRYISEFTSYKSLDPEVLVYFYLDRYAQDIISKRELNLCYLHFLGEVYWQSWKNPRNGFREDQKLAFEKFNHVLEIDPYFSPSHLMLAKYYLEEDDYQSAAKHLYMADMYNILDGYNLKRDIDAIYRQLLEKLEGKDSQLLIWTMMLLNNDSEMYDGVIQRYKFLRASSRSNSKLLKLSYSYNLALTYYLWGELEKSVQELESVLEELVEQQTNTTEGEIFKIEMKIHQLLSEVYLLQGKTEAANIHKIWVIMNQRAAHEGNESEDDELLLAKSLVMFNSYSSPDLFYQLNNLAYIYAKRGQLDKAAKTLRRADSIRDKNIERFDYIALHENLKNIYESIGHGLAKEEDQIISFLSRNYRN